MMTTNTDAIEAALEALSKAKKSIDYETGATLHIDAAIAALAAIQEAADPVANVSDPSAVDAAKLVKANIKAHQAVIAVLEEERDGWRKLAKEQIAKVADYAQTFADAVRPTAMNAVQQDKPAAALPPMSDAEHARNAALELAVRLCNSVIGSEFSGISTLDIDGMGNWFDVRDEMNAALQSDSACRGEKGGA